MNKTKENNKITRTEVMEYYVRKAEMEKEKNESRQRVMDQQLAKVTGGKNIIVSNVPRKTA